MIRAARSPAGTSSAASRSPIWSPIVSHGVSEAPASWKTSCGGAPGPSVTPPRVGSSSPTTIRSSVDLPEPDSPTIASEPPAGSAMLTPPTASSGGGAFANGWRLGRAYSRTTSRTTSAGSGGLALTSAGASAGVAARSMSGSGSPAPGPPGGQRPSTPGWWHSSLRSPWRWTGTRSSQSASPAGQRGANAQPGGGRRGSGGRPASVGRSPPAIAPSSRGRLASRPIVYGWRAPPSTSAAVPLSTIRPA